MKQEKVVSQLHYRSNWADNGFHKGIWLRERKKCHSVGNFGIISSAGIALCQLRMISAALVLVQRLHVKECVVEYVLGTYHVFTIHLFIGFVKSS